MFMKQSFLGTVIRDIKNTLLEKKEAYSIINFYKKSKTMDSIETWEKRWKCIGKLKSAELTPYNHCVGLYKHVINNEIKYIGRAIELNNGGFRKRLNDYRRKSDSGRKHKSGQKIYKNLDKIITYILIVGEDNESIELTKQLEHEFIAKYEPEWNDMK